MGHKRAVFRILLVALAAWLAPPPAQAAAIKLVQSGNVAMSVATVNAGSPTFTAVDPTKAFIVGPRA